MTRATGCVVVLLTAVLAGTGRFLYGRRVGRSHATSSAAAPEAVAAGQPSATMQTSLQEPSLGGGPPTRDVAHALDAVRGALPPQSSSSSRRSKRQREPTCKNWDGGMTV